MTRKTYLVLMTITSLICWVGFVFVFLTINPDITNWFGFLLFYLSLFLALIGTSAIVGFLIRFIWLKHELVFNSVKIAFRHLPIEQYLQGNPSSLSFAGNEEKQYDRAIFLQNHEWVSPVCQGHPLKCPVIYFDSQTLDWQCNAKIFRNVLYTI